MNKFDQTFFKKYVPEGQELKEIIHTHPIQILLSLTIKIFLFVVIPVVFYYYSARIQTLIPSFVYLEIYLILVYIKIIYDIFDWYNDAWIVTNE
jgi:sensor histidine kinase YesM